MINKGILFSFSYNTQEKTSMTLQKLDKKTSQENDIPVQHKIRLIFFPQN